MYRKHIKRVLDIICSLLTILVFGWVYIIVAILVRVKIGKPVIFKQPRPGRKGREGKEKIFNLYKFRSMTNAKDEEGNLLPDDIRITAFGKKLRAWSIDELPEVINILKGDMSVVGPRPQLVRDMVYMTEEQRMRHTVRPGLTGLAQVNGRNAISWEGKLAVDLEYIKKESFAEDVRIILKTICKVFKQEGITAEGQATVDDFGDALLKEGKIDLLEYTRKQEEASKLLEEAGF